MKKKVFLSIFIVIVLAIIGLLIGFNWQSIKAVFNGQVIYTQEQVDDIKEDTWEEALNQEENYLSQINSYRQLIEQNEITINDLNSQIKILTKQNQEYAGANETLNQSVSTLQNQVNDLQSDISDLEDEVVSKQEQISNLQKQLSDLQEDNDDNLSTIISLNTQIANLESDIEDLNNTITNYTGTINSLNLTINNLNSQIEDLEESQQSLQSQVNSLTSQITEYQQEIENYESIIETLQRENFATVIFKIENEVVSTQSIKKGTHPTEIEDERLNDESFKGWVIENTIDIIDPYTYDIESNVIFVAYFEKTSYQVTFKVNNAIVDTQTVNVGQYATDYVVSETEDYVFDYWTVNGVKVDNVSTYQINADTEFVAVLKYYKTVTYKVAGQEDYAVKVLEGNKIEEKYVPTFTNNTYFAGWEYDNQLIDESNFLVVDNVILVAKLNYINSSYHFVSLVDYHTPDLDTKTWAHRVTIDFEIKDNELVSFDLYVEMKGSADIWLEVLNYSINWLDFVEFDKKTQEIKVNVSFDVDSSFSSEAIETLKSYGFNSLLNLDLKYNSDNIWEMFDYMECWGTTSKILLGQTQNIEFVVGESQTTIKED